MLINGILIAVSGSLIAAPSGVDVNDLISIAQNIHRYEIKHFIFPFLAHGLASLIGAFIAAAIAASHKMTFAMVIGTIHLIGEVVAAKFKPAPSWFITLDLVAAYLPAAWIGGKLDCRRA